MNQGTGTSKRLTNFALTLLEQINQLQLDAVRGQVASERSKVLDGNCTKSRPVPSTTGDMHRSNQRQVSLSRYPIPFLLCASDGGGTWHRSVELAPTHSRRAKAASDGEIALRWAPLGAPSSGSMDATVPPKYRAIRRRRGSSTEYSDHATGFAASGLSGSIANRECEMQSRAPWPGQNKAKRQL